jgi:GH18 family chitinase
MTSQVPTTFEIATWYDTWNQLGLDNLANKTVPLNYATRYNLAFGQLSGSAATGYTPEMPGQFADAVKEQISSQASGVVIYASLGPGCYTGITEAVQDNNQNDNRSTKNIVAWLQNNGYSGISIDAENQTWPPPYMPNVAEFVTQLGPSFRAAGLGIAVSAPWPGEGPGTLYGDAAVQAFNDNVDAVELQDYSSTDTPTDAQAWTSAGVKASILMGGVCTENSDVQTSLPNTQSWTQWAMQNGLKGMFSWRLDNDHGTQGQEEDVDPTFTGAKTVYDTVTGSGGQ